MRSIECGVRSAGCGVDARPPIPHSALRIPHLLAGGMVLALGPPPASAQQADSTLKDTTSLPPVVVTGVRLPTVRELARGLAGRTATLDVQALDARGVRSLADALEQLPGVTTSDELGATAQLDVSLRGFQVSPVIGLPQGVTVYVDGVRANQPDAHEVNFDLLPLEDVERVDVVYGPSVLLGRNALGAAVNLVTRRGGVPASRELEASAGSWGRYELKAHAGARHFVGEDSRQRNTTRAGGGAMQLSGKVPLGRRGLRWLAGADADYEHVAVRIFAVPGSTAPDSLTESVRTNQVNAGAFAGANLEVVPRLTATLAARYDWIRVPFEDLIDTAQSGLNIFRRVSPRAGLTWTSGRGHEVFASASRGFRAPAVVELGCADPQAACPLPFALGPDPALRPVVATTYELGWHYRAPHGGLDAGADAYRTDVRDDIFFIASTVTGGYFQNISATRRQGLELALQWLGPTGARA